MVSDIDILKIEVESVKDQYFLLQVIQFFKDSLFTVFKFLFGVCVVKFSFVRQYSSPLFIPAAAPAVWWFLKFQTISSS